MGGRGTTAVTTLSTRSNTTGGARPPVSGGGEVDFLQTKIANASGTNAGGVYRGSDGIERYVKFYKDPTQAFGEALANNIYRDLGIAAPKSVVFTTKDGKTAFASEMIKNTSPIGYPSVNVNVARQIMNGYAADVLVSNRDVIGLVNDNIVLSRGKVVRIDNGASFLHRAQGARKPTPDLNSIGELNYYIKSSSQYQPIASKAGIKSPSDMGKNLNRQINVISRLRNKYGSWDRYVKTKFPKWTGTDKNRIVEMLEARHLKLQKSMNK